MKSLSFGTYSLAQIAGGARFWRAQAMVWATYAFALMVPWLGTYTVSSMLPRKVIIAGLGLSISALLGAVIRGIELRRPHPTMVLGTMVVGAVLGGFAWNIMVALLVGSPGGQRLGPLSALDGGVPRLSGGFYHALVLLTWSVSFVGMRAYVARLRLPNRPERIQTQDGRRTVLFEADEIDWVEADGDYVRVHAQGRKHLLRDTISRFESTLPPGAYVRIHRSSIINVRKVREVKPQRNQELLVVLRDGTTLKASRTYAERLHTALRSAGLLT